jgi:Tfp pilus assembly protein PilF
MADPTSSLTYYIIAYTYSQLGDGVNSEKNLKKAIEIFPGYREAVSALGNIYITQNKISEARTVYNNYLSINPSDPIITKMLTSLGDTLKTNK